MLETQVEIINKLGLHARAATKFASTANKYTSNVQVCSGGKKIDGKSIMSLMLLAAAKGSQITLQVEGEDATETMNALINLINDKFGEEE